MFAIRNRIALVAVAAVGLLALTAASASASSTIASSCHALVSRPAGLSGPWPAKDPGAVYLCSATIGGLTRTAYVYQPTTWQPGSPEIVVLHGCAEQGPDIARLSQFDVQAERHGFIVVYPNQASFRFTSTTTFDGNGSSCWNEPLPQAQQRDFGEPALIAQLTLDARQIWQTDPGRTYVIGISAGGAMADGMAATYPDVFAAVSVLAGCEYKGVPCLSSASAVPPSLSGEWAYEAAPGHARPVPFLVEGGDTDPLVPLPNSVEVVQQWQYTADYAVHHGTLTQPVPSAPCGHTQYVPSNPIDTSQSPPAVVNPYDVFYYSVDGSACPDLSQAFGQFWIVHGESHAWPGGPSTELPDSNPGGPDFTAVATQFFLSHPCKIKGGFCAPS